MKVLLVCYKMPFSDKDGGAYSVRNSAISLLEQPNIELKILAMNTDSGWESPAINDDVLVKRGKLEWVSVDTRLKPFKMTANFFQKESYLSTRFISSKFADKLAEILLKNDYDVVQLEHLYLAHYISTIRSNSKAKIVLRAQNVECELWQNIAQKTSYSVQRIYLKWAANRLAKMEWNTLHLIDGLICLSAEDLAVFRRHNPTINACVIPVGFNFETNKTQPFNPLSHTSRLVYHLGSMDWLPNEQGIRWFLKHVLPILALREPQLSIHLAGKKMPKAIERLKNPNLIIDGEVDNAIDYQSDKSILIVPLISGGGIRVKIVEAMALGKVVISTTIGAQGIGATHNQNILIANQPENFAQAIIDCWKSAEKCHELSQNAQEFAHKRFSLVSLGKQTQVFYAELCQK